MATMSTAPGKARTERPDSLLPVTTKLARRVRRTSTVLLAGALVVAVGGPAGADVPEGWSNPSEVEWVEAVLLLVGVPLLLFAVITLIVLLPSLIRGERFTVAGQATEDQWFGGPRQGTAELPAPDSEGSQAGGASARW
jgi:hypothetical protein